MIYFLQREDGDIKIGTTIDYWMRLRSLIAQHGDLTLLGIMEGGVSKEKEIHQRFFRSRRGRTEFFAPSRALLRFISRNTTLDIPEGKGLSAYLIVSAESCDLIGYLKLKMRVRSRNEVLAYMIDRFTQGGDPYEVAVAYRERMEREGKWNP